MGLFHMGHRKEKTHFYSPLKGQIDYLVETPDEAFSGGMMGDGVVIFPTEGVVYAPCSGEVKFVFPTKHAIGLKSKSGYEILVHVGISSVKLDGVGFDVYVKEGDTVKKGDRLMQFDLELVQEKAGSSATPVIITNLTEKQHLHTMTPGYVEVGEDIFHII